MATISIPTHDNSATAIAIAHLIHHVRPILDILPEVADVATNLLVGFDGKRDHGDEAKGKPFPALHDAAAEVAAVLALHRDVFGAFERRAEGWCARLVLESWNECRRRRGR